MESKKPLILAIETAIGSGSIALLRGPMLFASSSDNVGRAEEILVAIEILFQRAKVSMREIDRIAVSVGPGSFTGIRIGIATGVGLNRALKIDCVGVPVLLAMAVAGEAETVFTAVPIGREKLGVQQFRRGPELPEPLSNPFAVSASELKAIVRNVPAGELVFCDQSSSELADAFDREAIPNIRVDHANLAAMLGRLAVRISGPLEPLYLRP
jgi:tRNA threonylcarbamoyl adenosine modification protein YeaZ